MGTESSIGVSEASEQCLWNDVSVKFINLLDSLGLVQNKSCPRFAKGT